MSPSKPHSTPYPAFQHFSCRGSARTFVLQYTSHSLFAQHHRNVPVFCTLSSHSASTTVPMYHFPPIMHAFLLLSFIAIVQSHFLRPDSLPLLIRVKTLLCCLRADDDPRVDCMREGVLRCDLRHFGGGGIALPIGDPDFNVGGLGREKGMS